MSEFNEAVQDLAEACHDYIEAERPDSGQGSWGRAMMYGVMLDKLRHVFEVQSRG